MTQPPIVTPAFVRLWVAHFLQALGFSSMLLLPLYLDHLGASRAEIGAAMAAASFGGLAARPAVGWALDTLGRKPVLFAGTLVLFAGMASVGLIDRMGPLVFVMRILVGLGTGTLFTGYFTLAADLVPASRRTEGIALFGISGLAPLMVNPLRDLLALPPEDLRWFLPVVGCFILASLLFLPGVPEGPRSADARAGFDWGAARKALQRRSLIPVWSATIVFAAMVSVFMSFVTVAAEARQIPAPAAVWAAYSGGAVAVRLVGASLPDRLGTFRVGAAALLCYSVGIALAGGAQTTTAFLVAGVLGGIGHGYCFPVLTGQVVTRSPLVLRGVAMAAFTGLWEIARLACAPGFGALADAVGDGAMLQTAGACGAVGVGVWWALERSMAERP
ncbi:MAG: MFS transporter [Deltaproteobacteria bacterium]|nr:MFS transporter [Deltaproteobacteria bacterium]